MNIAFDPKSNTLTIEGLSVNPKSQDLSESGKTYKLAYERGKVTVEGREATVAINVFVPAKKGKK